MSSSSVAAASSGPFKATACRSYIGRRSGARVRVISPDLEAATAMGVDPMRSAPRRRVIAAGLRQGRELCVEVAS
jgi:hypothetical protein